MYIMHKKEFESLVIVYIDGTLVLMYNTDINKKQATTQKKER